MFEKKGKQCFERTRARQIRAAFIEEENKTRDSLLASHTNMELPCGFHYQEGHNDRLFIDQTAVRQVIDRLSSPPTPFILYSLKQFSRNVDTYQQALRTLEPVRARLSYSMKANYNPHLLPILKSARVMLTTVSGGEMQLALSQGFEVSAA